MNIQKISEEIKTKLSDPRRAYGNLRHRLENIVIIGLLSTISLGEDFVDMEEFGLERKEWLGSFLDLECGIPDSDTFRRVFEKLDPTALSACLESWQNSASIKGQVVNIDGKTIRGSGNDRHKAYHVVSAWVAENQITPGKDML